MLLTPADRLGLSDCEYELAMKETGEEYKSPEILSYMSIPVLEFLNGLPWNVFTMNMLVAVRPSALRVLDENAEIKCDACCWRVTVTTYKHAGDLAIRKVEQEVMVGLAGDFSCSDALNKELREMGMRRL
jgi:hypothetical protein